MATLTIAVCFACAFLTWMSERNFYNPGFLMSLMWGVILSLANLRLYGLFEASSETYLVILIGIIAFNIGCFATGVMKVTSNRVNLPHIFNPSDKSEMYDLALKALCILSVVLLAPPAIKGFKLILSGVDMSYIRTEENGVAYGNPILRLLYNYIVRPFSYAILPIFAADFFVSKKKDKFLLICSILIVAERVLIEGGRVVIMFIISSLLTAFAVTRGKFKLKKGSKALLLVITVACVYAIYQVSLSRGATDMWYTLYIYFCGCVPHLSYRLNQLDVVYAGVHTYGMACLNGVLSYIFAILDNLGISAPQAFTAATQLMNVENKVAVTSDVQSQFNAFVGPYFYMYLDGGYFGVILGMLLYGILCYHFYKKLKNKISYRDLTVYILLVQGIITSMVRLQFVVTYYTVAFVFIYFLINKNK